MTGRSEIRKRLVRDKYTTFMPCCHSSAMISPRATVVAGICFPRLSTVTVACVGATVSLLGTVGGDARWVGALGAVSLSRGAIPDGLPYVAAPTHGWPNVTVLAQALAAETGPRALLLSQVVAVVLALGVTGRAARRDGADDGATAAVLAALAAAAALPLLVIRLQLVSLPLFAVLVAALRSQARRPSAAIWWTVPLLAIWSNLHGAAVIGLAVTATFLVAHRARQAPLTSALVLSACALALCVTPAWLSTPSYYAGVLGSVTAERRTGLWAPVDFSSPFDVLFVLVASVLVVGMVRARPALWEWLAVLGLAVATAQSARNGVWLLLLLAGPAARGLVIPRRSTTSRPLVRRGLLTATGLLMIVGIAAGPRLTGASAGVVETARRAARGSAVAADGVMAEQLAAAGGCVWIADPLDAVSRANQARFLDWEASGDSALLPAGITVVLVRPHGPADRVLTADRSWWRVASDRSAVIHVRQIAGPPLTCVHHK